MTTLQRPDSLYLTENAAEVSLQSGPAIAEDKHVSFGHCLIASTNSAHRKLLAQAADRYGWDAVVCDNLADSRRSLLCTSPQLAFVDLQGASGETFRDLVEEISGECQTLLVVCGNEDDITEEIWARQLGVWFYLPGLRPGGSVGLLFRDARTIVEARSLKRGHTRMGA